MSRARALHQRDLSKGLRDIRLPGALDAKYSNALKAWGWQWIFPSRGRSEDPRTGKLHRQHLSEVSVQKAMAIAIAAKRADIIKPCSSHLSVMPLLRIYRLLATIFARFKSCSAIAKSVYLAPHQSLAVQRCCRRQINLIGLNRRAEAGE